MREYAKMLCVAKKDHIPANSKQELVKCYGCWRIVTITRVSTLRNRKASRYGLSLGRRRRRRLLFFFVVVAERFLYGTQAVTKIASPWHAIEFSFFALPACSCCIADSHVARRNHFLHHSYYETHTTSLARRWMMYVPLQPSDKWPCTLVRR